MNPETALRRLTCLVLFLALGLGLTGGPHPCQALQPAAPAVTAAPEPAHDFEGLEGLQGLEGAATACSAHDPAAPAGPGLQPSLPDGERDCCAEHSADCTYACQVMAGVAHGGTPQVAVQAAVRTAAPVSGLFLPLFAHAIDHIPLA